MKKFFVLGFLLLGLAGLNLCGCTTTLDRNSMSTPTILEPQGVLKFSDVPVPVGFKLSSMDSYIFETDGIRTGILKYTGKVNPDHVVRFYREQMPMYNWVLVNSIEFGERLLNFDRDAETCNIILSPKGGALTIFVGPKSPLSRKASARTVK